MLKKKAMDILENLGLGKRVLHKPNALSGWGKTTSCYSEGFW